MCLTKFARCFWYISTLPHLPTLTPIKTQADVLWFYSNAKFYQYVVVTDVAKFQFKWNRAGTFYFWLCCVMLLCSNFTERLLYLPIFNIWLPLRKSRGISHQLMVAVGLKWWHVLAGMINVLYLKWLTCSVVSFRLLLILHFIIMLNTYMCVNHSITLNMHPLCIVFL